MKIYIAGVISLLVSLGILLLLITKIHLEELRARGELMLCLKETKGELHQFIIKTEKINWAISHIDKAKYLILIPGLAAVAANTERAKELIQQYQNLTLAQYLLSVSKLHQRCRQGPQSLMTPYQISVTGFKRHFNGTTMRRKKWSTYTRGTQETAFISITEINSKNFELKVGYQYSIKKGNVWSLLPSSLGLLPSLSQASFL